MLQPRIEFANKREASAAVKKAAKFFKADLVGIADYDERWVYTHSFNLFTKVHEPIIFPFEPTSVVVMAVAMDYEAYRTSSSCISSAATGLAYGEMIVIAHRLANFIRELGYHAIPCGNDTAMSVPYAIAAGIGEMSRLGPIVTPEFGPRVRLCKVITDFPLDADRPITFGVQEVCKVCLKCAEACPSKALSFDREPGFEAVSPCNNPGTKKWYIKAENCFKYWSAKIDCSACIAACPYNKKNTWYHKLGLQIAKTPARRLLKSIDDMMGYGKTFDTKTMTDWESSPAPKR